MLYTQVFVYFHHGVLVFREAGMPNLDNMLHECLSQPIGFWVVCTVVGLMFDPCPVKILFEFMSLLPIEGGPIVTVNGFRKSMAAKYVVKRQDVVVTAGSFDHLIRKSM